MLKTPKTVAQAIAPFQKIKTNLIAVMEKQAAVKKTASAHITAAQRTAAQVEKQQTQVIADAAKEEAQAKALVANIEKLLAPAAPDTAESGD